MWTVGHQDASFIICAYEWETLTSVHKSAHALSFVSDNDLLAFSVYKKSDYSLDLQLTVQLKITTCQSAMSYHVFF